MIQTTQTSTAHPLAPSGAPQSQYESDTTTTVDNADLSTGSTRYAGLTGLSEIERQSESDTANAKGRWSGTSVALAVGAGVGLVGTAALVTINAFIAKGVQHVFEEPNSREVAQGRNDIVTLWAGVPAVLGVAGLLAYQCWQFEKLADGEQKTFEDLPPHLNFVETIRDTLNPASMKKFNNLQQLYREVCDCLAQLPDHKSRHAQRVLRNTIALATKATSIVDYDTAKCSLEKLIQRAHEVQARVNRLASENMPPALGTASALGPSELNASPSQEPQSTTRRQPKTKRDAQAIAAALAEVPPVQPLLPSAEVHQKLLTALVELMQKAADGSYPLSGRDEAKFRTAVAAAVGGEDKTHWHHGDKNVKQKTARSVVTNVLQQFRGDTRVALENWFDLHAQQFR